MNCVPAVKHEKDSLLSREGLAENNIDMKEESSVCEDSADRNFYQQLVKSESVSDDEQVSGSSVISEVKSALCKTETISNTDSEGSADRDFYQHFVKGEPVSDDEQDSSEDKNALCKVETVSQDYQCSVCDEVFSDKLTLDTHSRSHINNIPGLKCVICKKILRNMSCFILHMKLHLRNESIECTICNKSFARSCNLTRHMKIHEGVKDYECCVCKKKFRENDNLKAHVKTHQEVKDYECTVCKKQFTRCDHLDKHMKIHERVKLLI